MCITFTKKNGRATHRIGRTLNNPHTDGSLHSEFTEKNKHTHTKNPGLHLKIETRAVMFVVLHGTCSVVPNTDCSQHLHMGIIQSEKGLVADLLCRQLFSQPLIYFLPCWWILRLTHFIWRHNLKIKCLSGTVQVERERKRERLSLQFTVTVLLEWGKKKLQVS